MEVIGRRQRAFVAAKLIQEDAAYTCFAAKFGNLSER
jgi:hypothetical protein